MPIAPSPYPPEVDAHLWRGYRSVSGELKLGIVMESTERAPLWIARLLNLLIAESAIKLDVVYRLKRIVPPQLRPDVLFRFLRRQSEAVAPALAPVPISIKPACCFVDLPCSLDAGLTEETRAKIAKRKLDVLLLLDCSPPVCGKSDGLARLGVWAFCLGNTSGPQADPPYWREVLDQELTSQISLIRYSDSFENAAVITSHHAPTQLEWAFTRNAEQPTWMAGPLLIRSLLDALATGTTSSDPSEQKPVALTETPHPGLAHTLRFAAQRTLHSVRVRARRRRNPKWCIGVGINDENAPFVEIPKAPGSDYADPFVIENGGRNYLFFEDVPPGESKGRISCLEIIGPSQFGSPFVALELSHHLSYPFVFEHNGDNFMIPESAATFSVPLYRAQGFPHTWEHVANLVEGIPIVDATPFFWDGLWYLFIGTKEPGVEALLFCADRLDGKWHYHPANPISSDARNARPAGALFYDNGALFRPAQDHSVRYGYAIVLNQVLRLSKTEYQEHPVRRILPTWKGGLLGTHTWNTNANYKAIDGLRFE
jgi:hypothetical protein